MNKEEIKKVLLEYLEYQKNEHDIEFIIPNNESVIDTYIESLPDEKAVKRCRRKELIISCPDIPNESSCRACNMYI